MDASVLQTKRASVRAGIKKHRPVLLKITADVDVKGDGELVLPKGSLFEGTEMVVGSRKDAGHIDWSPPNYIFSLNAKRLKKFGGNPHPDLVSIEYDVSRHVRSGAIVAV